MTSRGRRVFLSEALEDEGRKAGAILTPPAILDQDLGMRVHALERHADAASRRWRTSPRWTGDSRAPAAGGPDRLWSSRCSPRSISRRAPASHPPRALTVLDRVADGVAQIDRLHVQSDLEPVMMRLMSSRSFTICVCARTLRSIVSGCVPARSCRRRAGGRYAPSRRSRSAGSAARGRASHGIRLLQPVACSASWRTVRSAPAAPPAPAAREFPPRYGL